MPIARRITRAGAAFVHCELPDATVARIPLWMTDAAVRSAMTEGSPQVPLDVLVDLRRLLATLGAADRHDAGR